MIDLDFFLYKYVLKSNEKKYYLFFFHNYPILYKNDF